jgi:Flp pilus assembly protein TadD
VNSTAFSSSRIVYPFLFLLLVFLASCRSSRQQSGFSPGGLTLPDAQGVYIFDNGNFTRLSDARTEADAEELKYRIFSKNASILVFEKWMTDPDFKSVSIFDWKSIGENPMIEYGAAAEPVEDHPDMIMIIPRQPLNPGLYTVEIGSKAHGYSFGVETPDIRAYWTAVILERPKNWQAHNHLGSLLYVQGNIAAAYPHFQATVALNPGNPECQHNLGLALASLGQINDAIQHFEIAAKSLDLPLIDIDLGNAYAQVKRFDDAIKEYRHVIQLNPNNAPAYCYLGDALMNEGKADEGISEFRKAVELAPNMPQAQNNLKRALQTKASSH